MSDPSLLSILHLSDFHFTKRKLRDQRIVVDALVKDLESLCIGHRRPDVVMFTGDLVNAGGDDRHEEAYDFLLSRVAQATRCSDERIFIVPGNHDLSRKVVETAVEKHREWRNLSSDMAALNALYGSEAFAEVLIDSTHMKAHRSAGGGKGGRSSRRSASVAAAATASSTRSPMAKVGRSASC